jgi:hypothetical protein
MNNHPCNAFPRDGGTVKTTLRKHLDIPHLLSNLEIATITSLDLIHDGDNIEDLDIDECDEQLPGNYLPDDYFNNNDQDVDFSLLLEGDTDPFFPFNEGED